jgi:hypothetical protein
MPYADPPEHPERRCATILCVACVTIWAAPEVSEYPADLDELVCPRCGAIGALTMRLPSIVVSTARPDEKTEGPASSATIEAVRVAAKLAAQRSLFDEPPT